MATITQRELALRLMFNSKLGEAAAHRMLGSEDRVEVLRGELHALVDALLGIQVDLMEEARANFGRKS